MGLLNIETLLRPNELPASRIGSALMTLWSDCLVIQNTTNTHSSPVMASAAYHLLREVYDPALEPSRLRKGLWLIRSRSSRMAWFSSSIEKNFRFRRAAMIQRSTRSTPDSTLALSRGL